MGKEKAVQNKLKITVVSQWKTKNEENKKLVKQFLLP